jgi:predicted nucleic acid-binding protein
VPKASLVSNTSPLLYLGRIDHLHLLPSLFAQSLGLTVVGTVGILLRAKQSGLIPAVHPLLDALHNEGFHLHPNVYAEALSLASES